MVSAVVCLLFPFSRHWSWCSHAHFPPLEHEPFDDHYLQSSSLCLSPSLFHWTDWDCCCFHRPGCSELSRFLLVVFQYSCDHSFQFEVVALRLFAVGSRPLQLSKVKAFQTIDCSFLLQCHQDLLPSFINFLSLSSTKTFMPLALL